MIEIFDLSSCYMQKKKKLIVRYKLKLTLVYYWYILISLISDRPWALFCLFLRHLCTHFHRSALTGRELIWVTTCLHRYDQPHQPGEVTQTVNKGLYLCRYYISDKQKKKNNDLRNRLITYRRSRTENIEMLCILESFKALRHLRNVITVDWIRK